MGCLSPESRRVRGNIGGLLPRVLPSPSVGMAKTQRCTIRDRAGKALRLLRKKRGEPCWPTPRTVRQNRPGLARALAGSIPTPSRHAVRGLDRKSTRLNSSHGYISYAVFCLKKKKTNIKDHRIQTKGV